MQANRDMTMFAAEPQPLSNLREFRSEVNLARMTNFDPGKCVGGRVGGEVWSGRGGVEWAGRCGVGGEVWSGVTRVHQWYNMFADFSSFYSERGGFPHSQSMTSLMSEVRVLNRAAE